MELVGVCLLIKLVAILLCKNKAAESCTNGEMQVSPASVIRFGSSINISCILKGSFYNECTAQQLRIIQDNTMLLHTVQIPTNAVIAHIPKFTNDESSFACKLHCNMEYLICGIDIKAGYPPDQPQNLKCIQNGREGDVSCSWFIGRITHIRTNHILRFRNESHSFFASKTSAALSTGNCTKQRKTLLDQRLRFASESGHVFNPSSVYSAWVTASNQLGNQTSAVINFTLDEIVTPSPPCIRKVEFSSSSPLISTIYWQDHQNTKLFEIRYQSANSQSKKKLLINFTHCDVFDLEHYTEYEFQVRSKFDQFQGQWSEWSPSFISKTPEAVPTGQLDVWYTTDLFDPNHLQVTVFWKPLKIPESRGRILGYNITLQKSTKENTAIWEQTSNTWYIMEITRTGCTITVSAYNSKGNSPPSQLHVPYLSDLPAPRNISATYTGNNQFLVKWTAPEKHLQGTPIQGYVVEWADVNNKDNLKINWMKLPPQNHSATLTENIKPKTCFQISVYAIYKSGAGRPLSTQRYSAQEAAPMSGPTAFTKQNTAVIFWKNVPHDQKEGCIESYTIYLQEENSKLLPTIYRPIDPNSKNYTIPDLKPETGYIVWMTAVTRAGEGKNGEHHRFYYSRESTPPHSDSKSIIMVVVALTFLFAVIVSGFCLWQSVRNRIWSILSKLLSPLYVRNIPDPANCTWAKEYAAIKGKMELSYTDFHTESSFTYEDPETLQVEEISPELEFCFNMETVDPNQSTFQSLILIQSTASELQQRMELSQGILSPGNSEDNILDYKCQLPCLYVEKVPTVEINQHSDSNNSTINRNTSYIPSNFLHVMDSTEDNDEIFADTFSFMPLPSLARMEIPYGGKLTLDAVKIDCSSLVE
ncbi:interleukin-12 receptor subunit beta-2 isoform X1 [Chiloscyllium plagiosum]|uniref:interleukin-12 receptor subunit beta-2 isoform X1 n=1 Tax=Chiloscyllium plagiosum TaxID=36176 RepID=UPI001CB86E4C|nr:interleukin-12 receptor subunit beta-2 isoform X1 [Chiloscyllium plagiosum]XP_043555323.1 interleukin-12 receptor subunit beta-2 isoform X1 [Chiloscyllium plagiosum]XP_043555324.1 interleukin-12 receptor subunit beta-2 isoform X1 [Chiloscyllium plagiosum]